MDRVTLNGEILMMLCWRLLRRGRAKQAVLLSKTQPIVNDSKRLVCVTAVYGNTGTLLLLL